MTFSNALIGLFKKTQKITVYAGFATNWVQDHSVPAIGIRSYFAGYKNNDPVIDNTPFMVCGTVYYCDGIEATSIDMLDSLDESHFYLRLCAVAGFPAATIDLGKYTIVEKSQKDTHGVITLKLERID